MFPNITDGAVAVCCALLLALVLNKSSIKCLLKTDDQLTEAENRRIMHGLRTEILAELILFAPASATFAIIISPLILYYTHSAALGRLRDAIATTAIVRMGLSGAVGAFGYLLPHRVIKRVIRGIAISAIETVLKILNDKDKDPD